MSVTNKTEETINTQVANLVLNFQKNEVAFLQSVNDRMKNLHNFITESNSVYTSLVALHKANNKPKPSKTEFKANVISSFKKIGVVMAKGRLNNWMKVDKISLEDLLKNYDSIEDFLKGADKSKKSDDKKSESKKSESESKKSESDEKQDFSKEVELFKNSPEVESFLNFIKSQNILQSDVSKILLHMQADNK